MLANTGRLRVVIENVTPEIDCGHFPIKRTIGEHVIVEADMFADGHEEIQCVLLYKRKGAKSWNEVPMTSLGNDRWQGQFQVSELGHHHYTLQGWVDHFKTWVHDLEKRIDAFQDISDISVDLRIGAVIVAQASNRAKGKDKTRLSQCARSLRSGTDESIEQAFSQELAQLMERYADRKVTSQYGKELVVVVDREKARFSAWYEMFPRSTAKKPGQHGTFKDCEARLPYVAEMGFDVLYFPPIHPIGGTYRKGKNNAVEAKPGEFGSPWAIGSSEGGHKSIHAALGTLDDFRHLVVKAKGYGLEIALDIAYQCSPDHPYVKEHPEWFRHRPDGSIQYAENPPKKYQDIYPLDFETEHWQELWQELKSVVTFWAEQGVRLFRVDNPHTKPFPFWEWLIAEVKKDYPEARFLAEAFTRPKVMYRLAKLGFTQSYTYFTWRNNKWELTQYFQELTQPEVREFFRPNLWPNTPDILNEYLQVGGRPAFINRLVLAATLGANYGIYGPAFELVEDRPIKRGSEEYLDSEKYQIRDWDLDGPDSLKDVIARVNRIRRENPALQSNWSLQFHQVDNNELICYSKKTDDLANVILVVVNLDPFHVQSGWVYLDLGSLGLDNAESYQVHDQLTDARYVWHGPRNYVELNPQSLPAHILRLRRKVRTEQNTDREEKANAR